MATVQRFTLAGDQPEETTGRRLRIFCHCSRNTFSRNRHEIVLGSIGPDIRIAPVPQPGIHHVQGFNSKILGDEAARRRELVVDQEFHEDSKTE
jgi:hypothetical protein